MQDIEHKRNRVLVSQEQTLVMQPIIAKKLGRSPALFLQQLYFWSTCRNNVGITFEGRIWVHNTYQEWADNVQVISEGTVRRSVSTLRSLGIILTKNLSRKKSDRTNYYAIDYDRLKEILGEDTNTTAQITDTPVIKEDIEEPLDNRQLRKMLSPSAQNAQIFNIDTKITSKKNIFSEENTGELPQTKQVVREIENKLPSNLAQELIEIWNETVEEGRRVIGLTTKRAKYLVAAFKFKFESSLEKWRDYCAKIASSKFLMGEKTPFKATIDWGLKFDIIQKIFEGDYGIGDRKIYERVNIDLDQIKNQIQEGEGDEKIKEARYKLLEVFEAPAYNSWFKDQALEIIDQETLRIKTQSRFLLDHMQTHFADKIQRALGMRLVWE